MTDNRAAAWSMTKQANFLNYVARDGLHGRPIW
jgi:hypothetical protein